ncbi:MAG: rod shape-determining protein RodA, partial [Clostridiales bacterium]|nr:rod shape-determining protein RodA [Clostridiales bacterium]
MEKRLNRILASVRRNRFSGRLMRHFEWPLFLITMALSIFGVLAIYAATATPIEDGSLSLLEQLKVQPFYYARLQLFWIAAGLVVLAATVYLDYEVLGNLSTVFYWGNVALLFIVLVAMESGRGGATMFYQWGSGRTFQPSELGKIAIIISLAKLFANRERPIDTVADLLRVSAYVGLPLLLIVLQPDVGTALVYVAIFACFLFASGTNPRILIGILCVAVILVVVVWYAMSASDSFRVARIQVWLDPNYDINGAGMQTYNARIAAGSGGLWGKGLFSPGSFASLNYIPDDHTDFIFAIVCEAFGFVGAGALVALFLAMLLRMLVLSSQAQDAFGSYLIIGVMGMMLFHIFENIAMVIGLMPVTGIPLPFITYGGSNYLTNMMGIGLVINVTMRSRAHTRRAGSAAKRPA